MSVRRAALVAGIALAASILLGGCSGGFFGDDAGQGSGGTSGNGQSGTSGDGPVAEDPGTDDPTTPDDSPIAESESIPADFPAGIPLVDADVTFGLSLGDSWTVIFTVDDGEAAYTEQSAKLLAAGFVSNGDARSAEGSAGSYESADYRLQMTSSSTNGEATLFIGVQPK